ncbi:hypothetical protein, partial [Sphingobacterium multivorum]|uniref:hypothetical protein n=1 Tax=Sphingobacterium multivorum TaxID=28454 RepID=UPI00289E5082
MNKDNKYLKIYSTGSDLQSFGGAQKVMVDIHNGIRRTFDAKILGTCNFDDLHGLYNIKRDDYVKLNSLFTLKTSIILVNSRKLS